MEKLAIWMCLAIAIAVLCIPGDAQTNNTVLLSSFSVEQQSDNVQITLMFSESVTTITPCFVNKLLFLNRASDTVASVSIFKPSFPGACQETPGIASMDPRDFSRALDMGIFRDTNSTYMAIVDGMEMDFLPSLNLAPISPSNPIQVTLFVPHTDAPSLIAFDVDLKNNSILLHFTDLMDITNFEATQLRLENENINMIHTLSPASRPMRSEFNFVKTVCISLSINDKAALTAKSICLSRFGGCSCSYPPDLARNYVNVAVVAISPTESRLVSNLQQDIMTVDDLFSLSRLILTIDYIGCSGVTVSLQQDQVYLVRPGEYITRITCVASTLQFGVGGQGLNESRLPQEDGLGTYFSFPTGLQQLQYFGLYSCTSELETSEHYIVNIFPFIGLPEGSSYTVRLYDSLTIPLLYGSDPQLDILDTNNVEIRFTRQSSPSGNTVPLDPEYRRLSPYRAELFYLLASNSIEGVFSLEIRVQGETQVMLGNIAIDVTPPSVAIYPSIIALLPNETEYSLRCVTNNPSLQVFWHGGSLDNMQVLSLVPEFTLVVPPEGLPNGMRYYCAVRDPEDQSVSVTNRLAETSVAIINIPEPLSVFRDGEYIKDQSKFLIVNQLSGDLDLRCIGYGPSDISNLVWVSEQRGQAPVVLRPENNNNYIMVWYSTNEANISINNFIEPYRGILRCQSESALIQETFFVVEASGDRGARCMKEDVDPRWGISWSAVDEGSRDSQPCPTINGMPSSGFAFRLCNERGDWMDEVDVINCRSSVFDTIGAGATDLFARIGNLSDNNRDAALMELTRTLVNATRRRDEGLFPQDLNTTLTILQGTILELESLDVINNLLEESNVLSWMQLNKFARGGRQFIELIEGFSSIHTFGRLFPETAIEILHTRSNIYISGRSYRSESNYSDIVFPDDSLALSAKGQVFISREVQSQNNVMYVVTAAIENLQDILPLPPQEPMATRISIGASIVLSVQISTSGPSNFTQGIELDFTTNSLARVSNPRCAFWNRAESAWDETGVETITAKKLDVRESKTFNVRARSNHAAAFAVLVDQPQKPFEVFSFTATFYVGCVFVIFGAIFAMLAFLFSWFFEKMSRYSMSAYLTHMSLCCTLVCGYLALMAGLSEALSNMAGCVATSAIIHYFFTAAFAWIFCEALAITFFPWVSKNPFSYLLFFVLGWGLPAIPTIISLGAVRDQYTTTTHCWFFFDGELGSGIVLAFILPKLFLFAMAVVFLLVSCGTTCTLGRRMTKGQSKFHVGLLVFQGFGVTFLLLLLTISWVFALLHVNGGTGSISFTNSGWIFMVFSIVLGVWIFLFGFFTAIINQKIDYEVMWEAYDDLDANEKSKGKQHGISLATHLPGMDDRTTGKQPAEVGAGGGYSAVNLTAGGTALEQVKTTNIDQYTTDDDQKLMRSEFNDSFEDQ